VSPLLQSNEGLADKGELEDEQDSDALVIINDHDNKTTTILLRLTDVTDPLQRIRP
jgi:hypothetical protein